MKRTKRVLALAVVVAMALGLTACGKAGGTDDAASLMNKVSDKLDSVTSIDAVMDMDMNFDLSVSGETQSMITKAKANISSTNDPLSMNMDMKMNLAVGEETQDMDIEIYGVEEDGGFTMYTKSFDTWQKECLPEDQMEEMLQQYDAKNNLGIYLQNAESFKTVSTETVDGVEAYRFEGVLSGESLKEAIEASGATSQLSQLSGVQSEEVVEAMFKDLGDMPVIVWADKKTYLPVRYEMDMAQVMQKMMDNMLGAIAESSGEAMPEDFKMTCTAFKISMKINSVNDVEPIQVPQEAKDAAVAA